MSTEEESAHRVGDMWEDDDGYTIVVTRIEPDPLGLILHHRGGWARASHAIEYWRRVPRKPSPADVRTAAVALLDALGGDDEERRKAIEALELATGHRAKWRQR